MGKKKNSEHTQPEVEEAVAPSADQSRGDVAASEGAPEMEARGGPALEEELAAARALAEKNRDLYLRSQADLDNYRKRVQREKEELSRFANEGILRELLPAIDNLERAVAHAGGEQGNNGLLQGVELTLGQFYKVLEKFGVTPVKAEGTLFDPAVHEAIGQVESGKHAANTVVQELQKGYLLNDRLLRPALVMIAKAPPATEK